MTGMLSGCSSKRGCSFWRPFQRKRVGVEAAESCKLRSCARTDTAGPWQIFPLWVGQLYSLGFWQGGNWQQPHHSCSDTRAVSSCFEALHSGRIVCLVMLLSLWYAEPVKPRRQRPSAGSPAERNVRIPGEASLGPASLSETLALGLSLCGGRDDD